MRLQRNLHIPFEEPTDYKLSRTGKNSNFQLSMAEKKPLSLNERNDRLLQGLSQSRNSRPPPGTLSCILLSSALSLFISEQLFIALEEKNYKVKLAGRRRLCKASTATEEADSTEDSEEQIRDILDDLTFRLGCLSVENTKTVDQEQETDAFGSAKSSLSPDFLLSVSDTEGEKIKTDEIKCTISIFDQKTPEAASSGSLKSFSTCGNENVTAIDLEGDWAESSNEGTSGDQVTLFGSGRCKSLVYTLPHKIAKILYPHQLDGIKWLWSLHCGGTGGILGDDMGLGKTMQV